MKLVIAGNFRFPFGDAASNRVYEMARSLQMGGIDVTVLTVEGREKVGADGLQGVRSSVPYVVQRNDVSSSAGRISGLQRFFSQRAALVRGLECLDFQPDVLILYGASAWLLSGVSKWAKSRNVKVIGDVVEWYDVGQCAGGYIGPYFYDSQIFMRHSFKGLDGVIAISDYLQRYFSLKGMPVCQVPGLSAESDEEYAESVRPVRGDDLHVIYSGFPGKKDLFAPILQAARTISERKIKIRFSFTGRNLDKAIGLAGFSMADLEAFGNVSVHGWCSEEKLRDIRSSADVAVVLRTPGRSSEANFPQKLAEYMSEGKAVIVNDVGDMAKCVRISNGGIVLDNATGDALARVLMDLSVARDAVRQMGDDARSYALTNFDPKSISEPLCNFVKNIKLN